MEGKSVNNCVTRLDSDCKDSEDRYSIVSCNSGKMRLVSQSSSAAAAACVDVKQSDVMPVASTSTSGSGRDNASKRKNLGGNGQTRKEKPTPPDNSRSTKKIYKFWNFLSKKKSSHEVDRCDQQDVGDESVDDQSSTGVSCLCTGLRRLQLQLRVADEEVGASDYTMDDDDITTDAVTTCQSNGLPLDEAHDVLPDGLRGDSLPESAQRHSLPADTSSASAAVLVDDVAELFRSLPAQEDNVAALGHRAIYPHLSYGNGSLTSSSTSAAGSDASCSNHTWTIGSNSSESHPVHSSLKLSTAVNEKFVLDDEWKLNISFIPRTIHTQVDYIHCLVPDLKKITNCSYYWGVMDRYEAERLLDNRPEGTFLLRDSAQEEFLFSVSFRRYSRSLHARVEQWNHKFSFDSHDPSVYASLSVCGLVEHYKDPACCMFFEPMLTLPVVRSFPFSLQHLCRAAICSMTTYDGISYLPLPKSLHQFLQYYHYKQRVRVRRFESLHS